MGVGSWAELARDYYSNFVNGVPATRFPVVEQATDMFKYGTSNAPAANASIATLNTPSNPAAGIWDVTCMFSLRGTLAELDVDNMSLKNGATEIARLIASINGGVHTLSCRMQMDGATAISIKAIANSTAGSVYKVMAFARRVA